jgi:acyl carrier protein
MKTRDKLARTFDKIKKILVDELGVEAASIEPSASFIDDLNMDPDDIAEFFTTIEDNFSKPDAKFEIPDSESDNLITVQDLIDYLADQGVDD